MHIIGASEIVSSLCTKVIKDGDIVDIDEDKRAEIGMIDNEWDLDRNKNNLCLNLNLLFYFFLIQNFS